MFGQGFYSSRLWKNQRNEFGLFLGATNFLGELGGRDLVGSGFLWDLEFNQTRFAAGFSYQYYMGERHSVSVQGTFGRVGGHDNTTTEPFRQNRNLHFRSSIYEGTINYQFHFIKAKIGNLYNLRSTRGKKLGLKSFSIGMYGTIGIGGFYFNPQAQLDANIDGVPDGGNWINLAPLNTEGQGLPDGPEDYKQFSIAIPVGIGFRYNINREWGLKLEMAHRFTFTDYIDDVSTVYYDKSVIAAEHGVQAGLLADPNRGLIPDWQDGNYYYSFSKPGNRRGDETDRDGYLYAVVGIFYRPRSTNRGRYVKGKRRRIKASF